jgi:hypothetical protein
MGRPGKLITLRQKARVRRVASFGALLSEPNFTSIVPLVEAGGSDEELL